MDRPPKRDTTELTDLEEALKVAGFGRYTFRCILNQTLLLLAAILDPVGNAYVLPAAKCDLDIGHRVRGYLSSIPYIGFVLTAFPWGYTIDTQGRKVVAVYGSIGCGLFGVLAAFMPEVISFVVCEFLSALCLAGPASVPYTYISELLASQEKRDMTLIAANCIQIFGTGIEPLLAWPILNSNFKINFGLYYFRPWRLLVVMNAVPFLMAAVLLYFGPESPKFLVAQGRHDEALHVLQKMYAGNNRKSPEDYPVKMLILPPERAKITFLRSLHEQSVPLFKTPYIKWLVLTGVLSFGCFCSSTGIYIWVPYILNKAFSTTEMTGKMTACEVIVMHNHPNETAHEPKCLDKIEERIFIINFVTSTACAGIALCASLTVKYIGKKNLLIIIFFFVAFELLLVNSVTSGVLFGAMLSTMPLTALCIGSINAHAIDIFPVHLRGMAIGLCMLMARLGAITGLNITARLLNYSCRSTFYFYGTVLLTCGFLAFLLPKKKNN